MGIIQVVVVILLIVRTVNVVLVHIVTQVTIVMGADVVLAAAATTLPEAMVNLTPDPILVLLVQLKIMTVVIGAGITAGYQARLILTLTVNWVIIKYLTIL